MQVRESLVSSVGAGFALIAHEFGSVLIWGLIALVLAIVPPLIGLAIMGPAAFSAGFEGEPDAALFGAMMAGQSVQTLLSIVFGILAAALITPAIHRAVLLPRTERGFAWIRFGQVELYMGLFHIVMAVLFFVVSIVVVLLLVLVIGLPIGGLAALGVGDGGAAAGAAIGVVLLMIPISIGIFLAALYCLGRLWIGSVMITAEEELRIFDGWRLTKGLGWRLVGMQVVLILISFAIFIGFFVVFAIIAGIMGVSTAGFLAAPDFSGGGIVLMAVLGIFLLLAYFFLFAVVQAVWVAPWARAYEIIAKATGRSAAFGPATVFS